MRTLYTTSVAFGNHLLQALSGNAASIDRELLRRIPLRFFTLLVPAAMGSLLVSTWLGSLPPDAPLIFEPLQPPMPAPKARLLKLRQADPKELLPTLESLEGLFAPADATAKVILPAQTLPPQAKTKEKKQLASGLTVLESQINEVLMEHLDPFLLTREQQQVFVSSIPTGSPLQVTRINSHFGYRTHPLLHDTRFHPGVDLQAPMNTSIMSTADGVIEFAGIDNNKYGLNGFGQVVSVYHNFGFRTTYSHLNKIMVREGEFVKKGDVIGLSGKSGRATAPHLHYEVRFIHQYLNPGPFLNGNREHYEHLFQEKSVNWQSLIELIGLRVPKKPGQATDPMRLALIQ
ncbi:MAG: M23 family metallopeptidase [Magnetococcales bacterium]|nr:M23 family metallopeptidase [Magnetococcales bacterium]